MAKRPRSGPYVCGIDAALDVVSGKWKGLVLWELHAHGVRRFAELRRGIPGVSEKMLAQHLREMEADGLVQRRVYAEVPPKVEYSLTDAGASLNRALGPLGEWGRERLRRDGLDTTAASGEPATEHV
ncbi:winged helix-turn-helix transcriptional regulator [Nocardioides sp. T2.26MG-1]|uniref:winged helix-turn-helix transcriptional regulator n=1 Tax=Nocardioides sp. T2.26MG-1 TaxID=3041166 RepID=UPI002477BF20|nr:helix-turn-helix domain-containing protein [Nocardioides sp. T2.26MG-1]CAI9410185.1 putative HTH-type transcriptional regulator YybR [Nocardioides sp. T2.26MG-1]